MAISLTVHKKLWGRSGGTCAICGEELVEDASETGDDPTLIGVEAHIVAQSPDGPRGDSPLTAAQRNAYSNLILLCPNDHARIDGRPDEYPVAKLQEIKRRHEQALKASGQVDEQLQLQEEQWAALIESLDELMGWQTWDDDISSIFAPGGEALSGDVYRRLSEANEWIFRRAWPDGHPRLKEAIRTLGGVLNDFLYTFNKHVDRKDAPEALRIEKFYKTQGWLSQERYNQLSKEHDDHVVIVQDLALELTRYGNYIAKLVREEIDGSFRFNEGMLVVMMGPFMEDFPYFPIHTVKVEFDEADFANGEPYRGPEQFRQDRIRRKIRAPAWDEEA